MTWYDPRTWGPESPQIEVRADVAPTISPEDSQDFVTRDDAASVSNALSKLGTLNDKGASARPNVETYVPLTYAEILILWVANGIARRIVELPPKEMTRKGWTVTDDSDDPEVMREVNRDLKVHEQFRWGQTWARLHGGAIALIVVDEEAPLGFDSDPSAILATPLDPSRVREVKALQIFDCRDATPINDDSDIMSTNYRDPEFWSITPSIVGPTGMLQGMGRVHHSRVLWFRGARRPPSARTGIPSMFGARQALLPDDSVLQSLWDELRNLAQVQAGAAVLAQEIRENVLTIANLGDKAGGDRKKQFFDKIRGMLTSKSLLNAVILGPQDKWESKVNSPSGYGELSAPAMAMLSAVTGIPQTILFGFAPSGFATDNESGRQQFDRLIANEQSAIEPLLEQLYTIVYASSEGPTGGVVPEDWAINFLPLDEKSEKEEAEIRKLVADTDVLYIDRGVLSSRRIRESRFGEDGYQFEIQPVTVSAVPDIDDPELAAAELAEIEGAVAGVPGEPVAAVPVDGPAGVFEKLNGAQINAAGAIVDKVAAGLLPRDSGVAMLVNFFNLPLSAAESIMGEVGRSFALSPEEKLRVDADLRKLRAEINGDESVWVALVLKSEAAVERILALRAAASEALGLPLEVKGDPHVTMLFVGPVEDETLPDVSAGIAKALDGVRGPLPLFAQRVEAFPPDESGRRAVVVRLHSHELEGLHARLLRALAPMVSAPQFPDFKAHLTLGWVVSEDVDQGALADIHVGGGFEPLAHVDRVTAMRGGQPMSEVRLAQRDGAEE